MVVEADHLVVEIAGGEAFPGLADDAAVALDLVEAAIGLPFPVAAEADDGDETELVAEVVDGVVAAPDVLKADGVQAHVTDIDQLGAGLFGRILHEDVVRPAAGLEEDLLAVEDELAVTVLIDFAGDGAETEADAPDMGIRRAGTAFAGADADRQVVELGLAEVVAPPDAGLVHRAADGDFLLLSCGEGNGLAVAAVVPDAHHRGVDGGVGAVDEGGLDGEGGLGEVLRVDFGDDEEVLDLDVRGLDQLDAADDAHALVDGTGVPVGIAGVEALGRGLVDRHLEGVEALLGEGRDVKLADGEEAVGRVRRGDERAVEPDVGGIAQAVEAQDLAQALGGVETGREDPGAVELGLVDGEVPVLVEDVRAEDTGFVEGAGDGRRHRHVVGLFVSLAMHRPLRQRLGGGTDGQEKGKEKGYTFHDH